MDGPDWRERKCKHRDVVFLAEGLSGPSDVFGGLGAQIARALKAEKLAMRVASFDHAIGDEQHRFTLFDLKASGWKRNVRQRAQRQCTVQRQLFAVDIRR